MERDGEFLVSVLNNPNAGKASEMYTYEIAKET